MVTEVGVKHIMIQVDYDDMGSSNYRITEAKTFRSLERLVKWYTDKKFIADGEKAILQRRMHPRK